MVCIAMDKWVWLVICIAVDKWVWLVVCIAVDDLAKDGTYAGNDVIVAMTRCYGVDVVIHQLATPNWAMQAPSLPVGQDRRTLHVVYLRGEHYCSVRPQQPGHALPALVSAPIME